MKLGKVVNPDCYNLVSDTDEGSAAIVVTTFWWEPGWRSLVT